MIKLENNILTNEEESLELEMYSEIKNDTTTNVISVGDSNRSNSHECKQDTNNSNKSLNFIGAN